MNEVLGKLQSLPDLVPVSELINIGLFTTDSSAYHARLVGDGPDYMRVNNRIMYPKSDVVRFIKDRIKKCNGRLVPMGKGKNRDVEPSQANDRSRIIALATGKTREKLMNLGGELGKIEEVILFNRINQVSVSLTQGRYPNKNECTEITNLLTKIAFDKSHTSLLRWIAAMVFLQLSDSNEGKSRCDSKKSSCKESSAKDVVHH